MKTNDRTSKLFKEILGWIEAIVFAVMLALLIRGFVFETVYVDGSSMERTLSDGNRLFLYKAGYFFSTPKRGDMIVLQVEEGTIRFLPFIKNINFVKRAIPGLDETDYIKRVIALPGEEVDIRNGNVFINGERLVEPYVEEGITRSGSIKLPQKVEKNKVFVLGDNRQNSRDSREIGLIDLNKIRGKAVFRIWPLNELGSVY